MKRPSARVVLVTLTLSVLIFTVMIGYASIRPESERVTILHILSALQLVVAIPVYLWLRRRASPYKMPLRQAIRVSPGHATVGVLLLAAALLLVAWLTIRADIGPPSIDRILWLLFYQIAVIAVAEETLFRGIPFAVLPRRSWTAPVVSSLLFALYHWNVGPFSLPYFFALGLIFGALRHFGFPLPLLVLGHGLFNVALELVWPIGGFRFGVTAFYTVMPMALIGLAALAGWSLSALEKPNESRSPHSGQVTTRQMQTPMIRRSAREYGQSSRRQ